MSYFHGIRVNEPTTGLRPALEKSTAVIGLVGTASLPAGATAEAKAALEAAFPLNTPVLVTDARLAAAGAGTLGTLAKSLGAIADQGSPFVVVVRVATAANAADQTTAVVGGAAAGVYTGLQALLTADARVGIRPRIIGAPGLDTPDVVTAMAAVAKRLRGFVYFGLRTAAGAPVATAAAAIDARESYGDRELMAIWPDWSGWDGQAIATALGKRAMLDEQIGWHQSLSNQAIAGVTGISRDVSFDLRDPSTDAGLLNAAQITTLIRFSGFKFWGVRGLSDEPFFAFEVATRTAQAIQDAIADAEAPFIGKPMTVGTVRDIVETANARLAMWRAQGRLIGGECWFDPSQNPAQQLAAGALAIDFDYTPAAPLEGLTINQRITSRYYNAIAEQLAG